MTTNRAEEALRAMGLSGWPTIDPYLVWAWLTDFRDYFAPGTPRTVAVAIECRGPDGNVADLEKLLLDQHLDVKIPRLYTKLREAVVSPKKCRFCTAIANVDSLPSLVLLVTRLELGTAITEQQEQQAALTVKPSPASAVVGVIDDFVAFAHPCFAVDDHSRLTHVWSQEPVRPEAIDPTQWVAANEVGYGFELTSLPSAPKFVAPSLATLRDAYPTVMPRVSHGTPVACLAAGNRRDLQPPSSTDVIAVHLPKRVVDDTSGGAFNVQALDGIRRRQPELRHDGRAARWHIDSGASDRRVGRSACGATRCRSTGRQCIRGARARLRQAHPAQAEGDVEMGRSTRVPRAELSGSLVAHGGGVARRGHHRHRSGWPIDHGLGSAIGCR
jgi:hypothetical protein